MVAFHFGRDLEIFGFVPPGTTLSGGWYILARVVAGSFFFFAGMSLVFAHADGIRWRAFWRRLAMIAAAALTISLVTYAAMPSRFIYFGILHSIAVCSVIGMAFLSLPAAVTLLIAAGGLFLHLADWHPLELAFWSFTGLSTEVRTTLDLLPIVPWVSALLLGIAFAKISRPTPTPPNFLEYCLGWPGRHSLAIYLLHQPILLGGIWLTVNFLR